MWCYYNMVIKRSKVLLAKSIFMIVDVPVNENYFNEKYKSEKTNAYLEQNFREGFKIKNARISTAGQVEGLVDRRKELVAF